MFNGKVLGSKPVQCDYLSCFFFFEKILPQLISCPIARAMSRHLTTALQKAQRRPCYVLQKKIAMESYEFEVLNEVYLQNFLYIWVVNRETNLMMLINP